MYWGGWAACRKKKGCVHCSKVKVNANVCAVYVNLRVYLYPEHGDLSVTSLWQN